MTETNFIKIPLSLREMGDCFNCLARLKDDVARLKGVERVEGAADTTQLRIEFDPAVTSLEVIESYVSRQGARLTSHYGHEHYAIEGLDCPDCALKLEQSLSKIPGVTWVSVNFAASKIWFEYEADAVSRELILSAVKKAGYRFHEPEVSSVGVATTRSSFTLEGLDCSDCASKLQKRISLLDGIREIKINFNNSTMAVCHETGKANRAAIIAAVEEAGFRAMLMAGESTEKPVSFLSAKNRKVLSTMAAGCFMVLAWATYVLKPYLPLPSLSIAGHQLTFTHLFYLCTIATGGYYVARSGYYSLMSKTFDMNFLMSAAVVGALGIGEFEEGAMVVFLFSLGNTLQSYTMDKARNAL